MGKNTNKQQWLTRRNKYKIDKYGNILGEVDKENEDEVSISNPFNALKDKKVVSIHKEGKEQNTRSTRDWVNKSFGKIERSIQSTNGGENKGWKMLIRRAQKRKKIIQLVMQKGRKKSNKQRMINKKRVVNKMKVLKRQQGI